jgi:hypothetical protein
MFAGGLHAHGRERSARVGPHGGVRWCGVARGCIDHLCRRSVRVRVGVARVARRAASSEGGLDRIVSAVRHTEHEYTQACAEQEGLSAVSGPRREESKIVEDGHGLPDATRRRGRQCRESRARIVSRVLQSSDIGPKTALSQRGRRSRIAMNQEVN